MQSSLIILFEFLFYVVDMNRTGRILAGQRMLIKKTVIMKRKQMIVTRNMRRNSESMKTKERNDSKLV